MSGFLRLPPYKYHQQGALAMKMRLPAIIMIALLVALGMASLSPAKAQDPIKYPLPEPTEGMYDEAAVTAIDLKEVPILPDFEGHEAILKAIFEAGQKEGLNVRIFAKIGDCMSSSESYLKPISTGQYDLDQYTDLQTVIDHYLGKAVRSADSGFDSFNNPSLGAYSGFNAASVLDSTWNDPAFCEAEESPMACEYRVNKPAVALLMFGTNDLKSLPPELFDFYFRKAVVETANKGIVPIIFTFPNQPGLVERSILFNQITVKIAQDYGLPLVNLWRPFETLPNQGIDPKETTHMTTPASGEVASFTKADLAEGGHNMHNLLTLQALDGLMRHLGVLEK
jgi:hypothetical protein